MKLDVQSKLTITALILIVIFVGFYTYQKHSSTTDNAKSDIENLSQNSETASPFTDLDGASVDLAEYRGRILVVNSWASWCPFCVDELPDFARLASEYTDISVLAINRAEAKNTVHAFIQHVGNPKDIVFILDPTDVFYKTIGGFSMPETVFYDREGNTIFHKRGFMRYEEIKSLVDRALSQTLE